MITIHFRCNTLLEMPNSIANDNNYSLLIIVAFFISFGSLPKSYLLRLPYLKLFLSSALNTSFSVMVSSVIVCLGVNRAWSHL